MVLKTSFTDWDGCSVVTVTGELDLGTAGQLDDALTVAAAAQDGPLIVDLAELTFCDSAGLAVFVRTQNRMADQGRRFVLAQPGPIVSRILELSGLDQVIKIAADPAAAQALAQTS